jgi:hypothetical protein
MPASACSRHENGTLSGEQQPRCPARGILGNRLWRTSLVVAWPAECERDSRARGERTPVSASMSLSVSSDSVSPAIISRAGCKKPSAPACHRGSRWGVTAQHWLGAAPRHRPEASWLIHQQRSCCKTLQDSVCALGRRLLSLACTENR